MEQPAAAEAAPAEGGAPAGAAPEGTPAAADPAASAAVEAEAEAAARRMLEGLRRKKGKDKRGGLRECAAFYAPRACACAAAALGAAGAQLALRRAAGRFGARAVGCAAAACAAGAALLVRRYWRPRDAEAQFDLACEYHRNSAGPGSAEAREAAVLLRMAAEQGHPQAQYNLSVCLRRGEGVARDHAAADRWEMRAADQSEPSALTSAARRLLLPAHGGQCADPVRQPDAVQAVGLLQRAVDAAPAGAGRAEAQGVLGEAYELGLGVPRDPRRAAVLLTEAAPANPAAAARLGRMLLYGDEGVGQDQRRAAGLLRTASEAGVREASFCLGRLLEEGGDGVAVNSAEAARLYGLCCEGEGADPEALFALAMMHAQGCDGVPQDLQRARGLLRRAAAAPDCAAAAQYNLAEMCAAGQGGDTDFAEAATLYRQAAEQGDADACRRLSELYEDGDGVEASPRQAAQWARRAEELGGEG